MKTKKMLELEKKYQNSEVRYYVDFYEYHDGEIEVTLDGRLSKQEVKEVLAALQEAHDEAE